MTLRLPPRRTLLSRLAVPVCFAMALVACGTTAEQHLARAEAYARDGLYPEAVVEYRRALQENWEIGRAHYQLGDAYERINDYVNAAKSYVRAADMMPNDIEAQIKGASVLLLLRRFDEARQRAAVALRLDPRNIRALVLHAHSLAALRRTGQALENIREAIGLDPTRGETYAEFAVFQFATGSLEQAEGNLKKAADSDPPSTITQLALASLYWAQGRLEEAEARLKRAVDIDPNDVRASRALATFYLGNDQQETAETYLTTIVERSGTVASRLMLADYYIAANRIADAVAVLTVAANQPNGLADANSRLAALTYSDKRTTEAHRLIDDTLEREPQAARAILTKANFLLVERRLEEAETRLKEAVTVAPQSVPVRFALGQFYSAGQNVDAATVEFNEILEIEPDNVPAKIELARLNLAVGRAAAATQFAQQAANARPGLDTSLLLARSLIGNGEISRAETVLRPHLGTNRADILALAGGVYVGIGEQKIGRELLERAAKEDPTDPEPIEALVAMELDNGNIVGARAIAEQRLALRPRDSRILVLTSRTYGAAGDAKTMIALLRSAIEADENNTSAYALLGQVYATQGQLANALVEYERIIARDPRSVAAHTMVALLLEGLGRTAEAEKAYGRVLDLDPRAAVAANNLAWIIAERGGNLDEALQLAQIAKRGLPEAADVNDTLAWIYYLKDLPDMALPSLRLAVERDPNNPSYRHHMGLAYMKSGDLDSARIAFEAALKLNPSFPGAAEAREALQRIR